MTLLYDIYIRSQEHFSNNPHVNLQNNTKAKNNKSSTNRFYSYPGRAPSSLIATGLVRLVVLGTLVSCPLTVRIKGRYFLFLNLGQAVQPAGAAGVSALTSCP